MKIMALTFAAILLLGVLAGCGSHRATPYQDNPHLGYNVNY